MPNGGPTFKTAKEGVQILCVQFSEFMRTRELTCPIRPELDKVKKEIIQKIEIANNVHREEKYRKLEEELKKIKESEKNRKEERRKFWWRFAGLAFTFMGLTIGLFTLILRLSGRL